MTKAKKEPRKEFDVVAQTVMIPVALLDENKGQIEGVPKNPRVIKGKRFKQLCESIKEDPELLNLRPLLVYPIGDRYVVIDGNMRVKALRDMAHVTAPCEVLREGTMPEQMKRYIVKTNSAFGDWDWDALANAWDGDPLDDWGIDLPEDWGETTEEEETQASEDEFDEDNDKIKAVAELGDIWKLGDHLLMCGDSTDAGAWALLLNGDKADMVFTDPPYGVAIGDKNKLLKQKVSHGKGGAVVENIKNDTLNSDQLYDMLVKVMTNLRENCKDDAAYFVTAPQGGGIGLMMMMMRDSGLEVRHNLVWRKNAPTFSLGRLDYDYQHEPIMYTWTKSHHNYRKGKYRTSVWDFDKPRKCDLHPTMKPVELVANCLLDCTKEGDIVLDAFGGSGTTIIASQQLKRRARLMELDPHYCDVIIARWEKLTGEKAEKITNINQPK